MSNFDYKKYSLEQLDNWVHDAMSSGEASAQEIYDVIVDAVKENYYIYKKKTSEAYELLALLNGNGKQHLACDKDDKSPECQKAWNEFWEENYYPEENQKTYDGKEDKNQTTNKKWVLPVEVDGMTGDCIVNLPDDLLELANLKEGDEVYWIEHEDGYFEMRKVTKPLSSDEC
jgi:antitoxin component of MazEF toxin-antitoxin module